MVQLWLMKNMGLLILLVVGAIGSVGVVVVAAMDGLWWRMLMILVLLPMWQAAKVNWAGFKNEPHKYGTQQPERSSDGRGDVRRHIIST